MEQEMRDVSGTGGGGGGGGGSGDVGVRERVRSESGKENSAIGFSRPATRHQRRSERTKHEHG